MPIHIRHTRVIEDEWRFNVEVSAASKCRGQALASRKSLTYSRLRIGNVNYNFDFGFGPVLARFLADLGPETGSNESGLNNRAARIRN